MTMTNQTKQWHLLWRAGFGPSLHQITNIENLTSDKTWEILKKHASTKLINLKLEDSFVEDNYNKNNQKELTAEEKEDWSRKIRQQSNRDFKELNEKWIHLMVSSNNQLGEKMAFFWHNHFAIRHNNSFLQKESINIIRKHTLGSFADLLREISKSGAMILSLNNAQNRKNSPNENFAREIMELFSMGIGSYNEMDIKEAARAFTGWGIGNDGRFLFKSNIHDNGNKTFLGQSGNFDGDDIVDIILEQPQTANFIVTKIYRYFVNDKVNIDHIEFLSNSFYKDYDIKKLMETIFTSTWFFDNRNIGNKIKSPTELIVGLQRLSPKSTIPNKLQSNIQRLLGQTLFSPPSIAGWPTGKTWIDSSTLMFRLQLQDIVAGRTSISIKTKINDDMNMGKDNPDDTIELENIKNSSIDPQCSNWSQKKSIEEISTWLLPYSKNKSIVTSLKSIGTDKEQIVHALFNSLEYQLC